ncbi:hypothetical protein [Nonomuraea diastatica]|uniref:Uncharacterized protein n=1 Tax=Nonomuraea diastatica TaxID=1848329 RepID=A0A4V2YDJ7_9ACTN|nr:hypothetical protein [Nonomuraea diastatica]TDD15656.1 hypothetical protein E1294_33785 [Nonomuraea diastatica]
MHKYQSEGGPGPENVAALFRRVRLASFYDISSALPYTAAAPEVRSLHRSLPGAPVDAAAARVTAGGCRGRHVS